ncbi:phage major capsid protein [Rhodobacteraceae bacterium W635]|uniref:phage major capsid protein n=1 Tax=Nioella halotolerans TaxID=2303578 RepID=UPI000E3E9F56|nr:phage major capsid protein [Rhodobacteraceae bacterium W635]
MEHELKEAVDTVKNLNETLDTRLSGLERDVLAVKRASRVGGDLGDDRGAETKAMAAYLRSGETKSLSVTSDGQGVTVREDWSDRIFKLVRESSPMRSVASVLGTSKNEIEVLVDREEPGSDWVGETAARTATTESFLTRHKIAVHEHYALPSATLDMLDDSDFDVEGWLQGKVAQRFARQEATAFINGTGTGEPRGIIDYGTIADASFTWGADPSAYQIGAINSGVAGDLPATPNGGDPLMDVVDALKAPYLPGASWMMTRAMRNKIRKLKDSDGRYIYQASLDAAIPDRLLGYPVNLAEDMPALADGAVGALFGNFREAYTIADRVGLAVVRDVYSQPGYVRWYVRRRVGGALTNPEAVKALVLAV